MPAEFWSENFKGKENLRNPKCTWKDNINISSKNRIMRMWKGFVWGRKKPSSGLC
jgi:hypothetical protein